MRLNIKKNNLTISVAIFAAIILPSIFSGDDGSMTLLAQGEANFWYFGINAGLDFNGGAPVAVTNGQLSTGEGCSSISDAAGNLLFYTDGVQVWDMNHILMPNGFGLTGNSSTTQSALIVQKPGSTTIFYIFTADATAGANGIRYSEIDMTLNTGFGDVTANKNIMLNTPSCEKITGIKHCNNKDVWVVTHDWNSNAFRTYLITSAGVNTIPVISNAGLTVNGGTTNTLGQLKGSPDGKKIASAIYFNINRFELFDFNNSTGVVSNAILLPQLAATSKAYGVEFSPDVTKLYCGWTSPGRLYQFDLCAGSSSAIANSGLLIATSALQIFSLQLGPDKKIYVARSVNFLGVINNPNVLGLGCNYVANGFSLAGNTATLGLPNFVVSYFKQAVVPFTVSVNCLTGTFTAPAINTANCSGSGSAINSLEWNFGDPASAGNNTSIINNPSHTFTSAGTYNVRLVLNYACGSDTIIKAISVNSCGCTLAAQFTKGTANCAGCGCKEWIMVNAVGGTSPYSYSWPDGYINRYKNQLCPGNYIINIKDKNGCSINVNLTAP